MKESVLSYYTNVRSAFGETRALLLRAYTLKWTSEDGERLMNRIVEEWDSTDFSSMDTYSILDYCKTVLNMTIRAVELDLASNKRWKNGSKVSASVNFALVAVNPFLLLTGGGSAVAAREFKLRQKEDERLLEDLRSALYKY